MMFTWEWNPTFGAEKKPQVFDEGGATWTYARGGMFQFALIFPVLCGVWALAQWFGGGAEGERIRAMLFAVLVAVGWALARRFDEKAWRLEQDGHLRVLTRSGVVRDLGKVTVSRPVTEDDFASFDAKSFSSLRFPMLRFRFKGQRVGVIGTIQGLFSQGFTIPFTLGVFYGSTTWGSFKMTKGAESTAWIETEGQGTWLLAAHTPSALAAGLGWPEPVPDGKSLEG